LAHGPYSGIPVNPTYPAVPAIQHILDNHNLDLLVHVFTGKYTICLSII
jgi:hypothetical protein